MKRLILYIFIGVTYTSCEKFLDVGINTNEMDTEVVFANDNTAIAALDAIYHELQSGGFASGNIQSITFLSNVMADDAIDYNNTNDAYNFYTNTLRANNSANNNIWVSAYKQIYNTNALLEGIVDDINLSTETKQRINGEAKFIRAFIYYYLMHFYGEIPLVLTTDYNENKTLPRVLIKEIYTQIKKDLTEALEILPEDYRYAEGEHIRPTKYAAYTLMARTALWQKEYEDTILFSDVVIKSNNYELLPLNEVFLANSKESIWQLLPVNPTTGAYEGAYFILENNPETPRVSASQALTKDLLSVWESGDLRHTNWINVYTEGNQNYYFPFKYKIKNGGDTEEYSMVMRLAEIYLIRAEAYAMQGKTDKALADLNVLRNRAGLPNWTVTDIHDIQQTVLEERRRELFSEWGHRWLDLKRFGKLDEILGDKKSNWSPHAKLLPIPEQDLLRNPFLTQNPGY